MAMCIQPHLRMARKKYKKDGLTRPRYLWRGWPRTRSCGPGGDGWSLARQSTAIQEMLGGNGTERLLADSTRLESELTASENEEMSTTTPSLLVSTMSWAATALWVHDSGRRKRCGIVSFGDTCSMPVGGSVLQRTANFGRCVACFKRTAVPTPEKATQPSRGAWSCMPWHPPMLH